MNIFHSHMNEIHFFCFFCLEVEVNPEKRFMLRTASTSPWTVAPSDDSPIASPPTSTSFSLSFSNDFIHGLSASAIKELTVAATLAFERSSLKYVKNANDEMPPESQCAHHFIIVDGDRCSWAATVIFARHVHVLSPIIYARHARPRAGCEKDDEHYENQIDHVTGQWSTADAGLDTLHYTTVRDAGGAYESKKAKHCHEANVLSKSGPFPENRKASGPQQFFSLTVTSESLSMVNYLTHNFAFGSSGDLARKVGRAQTSLRPDHTLDEKVDILSDHLSHYTHIIILSTENDDSLSSTEALEINIFIGDVNDCFFSYNSPCFDCASEEGLMISYLDAPSQNSNFETHIFSSSDTCGRIPINRYAAVAIRTDTVKSCYLDTPSDMNQIDFYDIKNRPFFGFSIATVSQQYAEDAKIGLSVLPNVGSWVASKGESLFNYISGASPREEGKYFGLNKGGFTKDGHSTDVYRLTSGKMLIWVKKVEEEVIIEVGGATNESKRFYKKCDNEVLAFLKTLNFV